MNICLLAPASSVHTQRIVAALAARGHRLTVMTFHPGNCHGATVVPIDMAAPVLGKLNYLLAVPKLRRLLSELKPDILHAHYLPSYGLAANLTGHRPFLLSVWGTDIFSFPRSFPGARLITQKVLSAADIVMSTSLVMAAEAKCYVERDIRHTPFGINCDLFKPSAASVNKHEIIVGIVKSLEMQYGFYDLLSAFRILCDRQYSARIFLEIVGRGPYEHILQAMVRQLGISGHVRFTGFIPNEQLPLLYQRFTVAAFPSICQESFGVALLEAQACGVPVVATRVGGFPEVVDEGKTGLLIPPRNPGVLADAIGALLADEPRRRQMGLAARDFVLRNYQWNSTIDLFERYYAEAIALSKTPRQANKLR